MSDPDPDSEDDGDNIPTQVVKTRRLYTKGNY